jgi:hypothetical protein
MLQFGSYRFRHQASALVASEEMFFFGRIEFSIVEEKRNGAFN